MFYFSEKSVRELGNFLDLARTKTEFSKRNLGDVSDIEFNFSNSRRRNSM